MQCIFTHSGEQGYGELGEDGEEGDEEEGEGAQGVPGDHGGEGDHHQESVNPSFEPLSTWSVLSHFEEDADKEKREEAKVAKADEDEEKLKKSLSQAGPIKQEAPHHQMSGATSGILRFLEV